MMNAREKEHEFNIRWGDLSTFNAEVSRGVVHTPEYTEKMARKQVQYDAIRVAGGDLWSADVVIELTGPSPRAYSLDDLRNPATIVAVLKELGWHRVGDSHRPECPRMADSGNNCNCVPDASTWAAPPEVDKHLGEDWDSRLARRRAEKAK